MHTQQLYMMRTLMIVNAVIFCISSNQSALLIVAGADTTTTITIDDDNCLEGWNCGSKNRPSCSAAFSYPVRVVEEGTYDGALKLVNADFDETDTPSNFIIWDGGNSHPDDNDDDVDKQNIDNNNNRYLAKKKKGFNNCPK